MDLPLRQRTLRATIEWSYSLLNEEEERLLQAAGRISREPIARSYRGCVQFGKSTGRGELGIETLNAVASLVDKSLLQPAAGTGITADARRGEWASLK